MSVFGNLFGFGRRVSRRKGAKKVGKKPSKTLRKICSTYRVKLKIRGKYKSTKILKRQCAVKIRRLIKKTQADLKKRKSSFGVRPKKGGRRGGKRSRGAKRSGGRSSGVSKVSRPMPVSQASVPKKGMSLRRKALLGLLGTAAIAGAGAGIYRARTTRGDRQEHREAVMRGLSSVNPYSAAKRVYLNNRSHAPAPEAPKMNVKDGKLVLKNTGYAARNPYLDPSIEKPKFQGVQNAPVEGPKNRKPTLQEAIAKRAAMQGNNFGYRFLPKNKNLRRGLYGLAGLTALYGLQAGARGVRRARKNPNLKNTTYRQYAYDIGKGTRGVIGDDFRRARAAPGYAYRMFKKPKFGYRLSRFGNGGNPPLNQSMGNEFCSNGGGVLGANSTGLFPTPCTGASGVSGGMRPTGGMVLSPPTGGNVMRDYASRKGMYAPVATQFRAPMATKFRAPMANQPRAPGVMKFRAPMATPFRAPMAPKFRAPMAPKFRAPMATPFRAPMAPKPRAPMATKFGKRRRMQFGYY